MRKKGQSEVVTTILLILMVLAAVIIVWRVVVGFFPKGDPFECSSIRLTIQKVTIANAATVPITYSTVTIQRMSGGDDDAVKNIKILIGGEAKTIQRIDDIHCIDDDDGDGNLDDPTDGTDLIEECAEENPEGYTAYGLRQLDTKTYRFADGDIALGSKIEIAAILTDSEGHEEICEVVDHTVA